MAWQFAALAVCWKNRFVTDACDAQHASHELCVQVNAIADKTLEPSARVITVHRTKRCALDQAVERRARPDEARRSCDHLKSTRSAADVRLD